MAKRGTPFRGISQAPIIGKIASNERAIEELKQTVLRLTKEMNNLSDSIVNAQLTLATLRRCLKYPWWRRLLFGLWSKRWVKMGEAMVKETKEAITKQEEEAKKAQELKAKKEARPDGDTQREVE